VSLGPEPRKSLKSVIPKKLHAPAEIAICSNITTLLFGANANNKVVGQALTESPEKDTKEKSGNIKLLYELLSGCTDGLGNARNVAILLLKIKSRRTIVVLLNIGRSVCLRFLADLE